MATVSSKVFRHHKKADGTYNVKICIYHKKERVYVDTVHYLTEKKLTSIFTIKDPVVTRLVNDKLEDYRETISRISNKLDFLDVHELRNYLIQKDEPIDFIGFCQLHIDSLVDNKQHKVLRITEQSGTASLIILIEKEYRSKKLQLML
jgi:hypothetical protein